MTADKRYRMEADRACIDIELKSARQLFDERDPSPFRERDLSADAVEYIVDAAEEIPVSIPLSIVLFIAEPPTERVSDATIFEAVRAHFSYELGRLQRLVRQRRRLGQITLAAGLAMLALFLTLAELASMLTNPHVRQILREGLVIIGWVAIWRPLEVLLYDWWPLSQKRRLLQRIFESRLSIIHRDGAAR